MTQEQFKLTFTREQLTLVQVALLEAQISAGQDKRNADEERYMQMYRFIGTEKRRISTY